MDFVIKWGSLDEEAPHLPLSGYLFYGVVFALYFAVQHLVIHIVLLFAYPGYKKMNSHDLHEYRMQWNSLIHAILATWFAAYCMLYTCPDGKTFMNDENCRLTVRNSHVWLCFFTASYLLVDTGVILMFTGFQTPIDKQTFLHHVISFFNLYIAFWQQDFTVTIGAALLFMEISTPFICTRWLFFHHGLAGSTLQNLNTGILWITFILGRVAVQAYLLVNFGSVWLYDTWFVRDGVTAIYKVLLVEMALAVFINILLNIYWSFLITRQLLRVIRLGSKADETYSGDAEA